MEYNTTQKPEALYTSRSGIFEGHPRAIAHMQGITRDLKALYLETTPIDTLPPEMCYKIAKHLDSTDLCSFRLTSRNLASIGMIEISARLRRTTTISSASVHNEYYPRPLADKILDLSDFFGRHRLKRITFINISPRQVEHCNDAFYNMYFPALQELWIQNLELEENRAFKTMLRRHSLTLRELKIIMCNIAIPGNARRSQAYEDQSWNSILSRLSGSEFHLDSIELQDIHICCEAAVTCKCTLRKHRDIRDSLPRVHHALLLPQLPMGGRGTLLSSEKLSVGLMGPHCMLDFLAAAETHYYSGAVRRGSRGFWGVQKEVVLGL